MRFKLFFPFSRFWVLLFPALMLASCKSHSEPEDLKQNATISKISAYLEMEKQLGFSGIVALRQQNGEVFVYSSGYADRESRIANTANTVFDIGSLTKQFTGAAVLKLEEMKRLQVSDSLVTFFPDIPMDKAGITIHQLLIHSSGFPRRLGSDFEKLSREDFVGRMFSVPLDFQPGHAYQHSHLGYSLLGIIIEMVSGETYEHFLRNHFFLPLDMQQTGYVLPQWDHSNIARGYRKCRNWGKPMDLNWGPEGPYWNLKANGGLLSTAQDLMKWQKALEDQVVFGADFHVRYLNPYIQEGEEARSFYSYGWMITRSSRGTKVYAHEGGNGKFFSDWLNYPEDQVSILVLSNAWDPGIKSIATQVASLIFYPHHEPDIQLSRVQCFGDFQDNQTGKLARMLIEYLTGFTVYQADTIIGTVFGEYVRNKYETSHIVSTLESIRNDCGSAKIRQILMIGPAYMEMELIRETDRKPIHMQLFFDPADSYRIRRIIYNSD